MSSTQYSVNSGGCAWCEQTDHLPGPSMPLCPAHEDLYARLVTAAGLCKLGMVSQTSFDVTLQAMQKKAKRIAEGGRHEN